jgi:hypothetical protein
MPGEFRLEGDNGPGSVDRASGMLGAGDMVEIEDPDFMFNDNGEIIDVPQGSAAAGTPAGPAGAAMSGDAEASARVRREHEEGRQAGAQVSFTALSHVFLHCYLSPRSCDLALRILLKLQSWQRTTSPGRRELSQVLHIGLRLRGLTDDLFLPYSLFASLSYPLSLPFDASSPFLNIFCYGY